MFNSMYRGFRVKSENYRQIFSADTINIVVECGHPNSWYKHTNKVIGISSFGESAPGNVC